MPKKGEEQTAEQKKKHKFDYRSSRFFAVLFPSIYAAILAVIFIIYDIIPGPEFVILILLIYAAYNQKTWHFIKDWLPFLLIFMSYESMNGVVGIISKMNPHDGPYYVDLALFGKDPTLVLQHYIQLPILNYMGAFFYSIYFIVPTLFGFVVWKQSHKDYWKYTVSLGILTYTALVTFLVYPVAPPWLNPALTSQGVTRILTSSVDKSLGFPVYKTIYDFFGANLYAAFPSLHSALPWLVFLFAYKIWRLKALPVLAIPVGTWFSAVYLGEHYVTDVFAGIGYATFAFVAVERLLPYLSCRIKFLNNHLPPEMIAQ